MFLFVQLEKIKSKNVKFDQTKRNGKELLIGLKKKHHF